MKPKFKREYVLARGTPFWTREEDEDPNTAIVMLGCKGVEKLVYPDEFTWLSTGIPDYELILRRVK